MYYIVHQRNESPSSRPSLALLRMSCLRFSSLFARTIDNGITCLVLIRSRAFSNPRQAFFKILVWTTGSTSRGHDKRHLKQNIFEVLANSRQSRSAMPSIGPQIPPHVQTKRGISDVADSGTRKSESSSPEGASKRRRIVGPTAPPAPLSERPTRSADDESDSSSDDGYGPALPWAKTSARGGGGDSSASAFDKPATPSESAPKRATRDEWMTLPPKQDDLAARLDPTKIRARKFNTGKGAKGPSAAGGSENTLWTETPEEKRKRLADEVMGITPAAGARAETVRDRRVQQDDEEKARKIREHNVNAASWVIVRLSC